MEKLYFACPKTGQRVDVGIESELGTLLRIRTNTVSASCPICGEKHEWEVGDARRSEPEGAAARLEGGARRFDAVRGLREDPRSRPVSEVPNYGVPEPLSERRLVDNDNERQPKRVLGARG